MIHIYTKQGGARNLARRTRRNVISSPSQETTLIKSTQAMTTDKYGINSIHNPGSSSIVLKAAAL